MKSYVQMKMEQLRVHKALLNHIPDIKVYNIVLVENVI